MHEITPSGMSAYHCACGLYLTRSQEAAVLREDGPQCPECDASLFAPFVENLRVGVRAEEAHLLVDDAVYEETFFHATHRTDWVASGTAANRDGVLMVHVGSYEAALVRLRDSSAAKDWTEYTWRIFEVKVRRGTAINEIVLRDPENGWPQRTGNVGRSTCANDAIVGANRYVNGWEAVGSVSVLVPLDALEIIDCEEIEVAPDFGMLLAI